METSNKFLKRRKLKTLVATWPVPMQREGDQFTPIYASVVKSLKFDPRDSQFQK